MSKSLMSQSLMTALISVSLVLSPTAQAGFFKKALLVGGVVVVSRAVVKKHREHVQEVQSQQAQQQVQPHTQQSQSMSPTKTKKTNPEYHQTNDQQVQDFLGAYR